MPQKQRLTYLDLNQFYLFIRSNNLNLLKYKKSNWKFLLNLINFLTFGVNRHNKVLPGLRIQYHIEMKIPRPINITLAI